MQVYIIIIKKKSVLRQKNITSNTSWLRYCSALNKATCKMNLQRHIVFYFRNTEDCLNKQLKRRIANP